MRMELRPLRADEFESWLERLMAGYTGQMVASGGYSQEGAREKAHRDTERALPYGVRTPGHLFFRLLAGEHPVGWLWLAVPYPDGDPTMAWVYSIEVEESHRGRGYGRDAMLLAEAEARRRGMTSVGLNVHGGNTAAISLYNSLGYQVTAQQMKKPL
jgi:ribosomal protein S18 acetylase RimI-like enzyme